MAMLWAVSMDARAEVHTDKRNAVVRLTVNSAGSNEGEVAISGEAASRECT